MVDVVSPEQRSRMMAGIRGRNTLPEIRLRRQLFAAGFRFRLHRRDLPGRPDIVLPRYRTVLFVHGCFWHRHEGCRFTTTPATNREIWSAKFAGNVARDTAAVQALLDAGWRVAVVWECCIRPGGLDRAALSVLTRWLARALKGEAKSSLLVLP